METEFKTHFKQGFFLFAIMSTIGMMLLHVKLIISAYFNNGIAIISYNNHNELFAETYVVIPICVFVSSVLCFYVFKHEIWKNHRSLVEKS